MAVLPDYYVENFDQGTVTRIEAESIKKGAASDSLNWLTLGDKIELRRGMRVLGADAGVGKVTGLIVSRRFDGTEVAFRSRDKKLESYDVDNDVWDEIGSDILGTDADGEDVSFDSYQNLAGAWVYASSRNSSFFKIPVANRENAVNQIQTKYRGRFRIKQGRTFLWDILDQNSGKDETGLYLSYIDKDELSDYTETTNENVGTGDGATKNFTGTLTVVSGKKTCHYVRITDGTETFQDDRNGTLVGGAGGTGTINYATGAFDVTFNAAPAGAQAVTADYYTEDSTSAGILDFSFSAPRTAGQGDVFRQDDGGKFMNIGAIGGDEYCMHEFKTWLLTLSGDDTAATNLTYRSRVGTPYQRAVEEAGEGIYYVDISKSDDPLIRLLTYGSPGNEQIVPVSISDAVKLADYRFDASVVKRWFNYLLIACRHKDSTTNNTLWVYNTIWKTWDRLDFYATALDVLDGNLIAGDSVSNNVWELFTGFDDDDSLIANHWESGNSQLDTRNLKSPRRMVVRGLISPDQDLKVSLSYDDGPFSEVKTIEGDSSFVDKGQSTTIGSTLVGSNEIGGGGTGVDATNFQAEFKIDADKAQRVKVRFEAMGIGYVAVTLWGFKDIRDKGVKSPGKYIVD